MSLTAAVAMGQRSLAPDACRGTPLTAVDDHMDESHRLKTTADARLSPGRLGVYNARGFAAAGRKLASKAQRLHLSIASEVSMWAFRSSSCSL